VPPSALSSATDLARALRARELSCRELLDLYLARIDRLDPPLNAVVTLDLEGARRRADAADAALARGESWGPLHGLPMTIKDTFEVAGMRTTAGAPQYREHVPRTTAVAAQRLLDAGAIVFGKTNVPLLAGDVQSYNQIFGVSNNPWNRERTPGGSSGGAAAALAAGLTAMEFGSDIGGSIRTPSNWCGTYGLKPSWGVIPQRGHIPGPPGTLSEPDLNVVGPMARSADDLDLLLGVTAGPLPEQARGWSLALPPPRRTRLRDYRVAACLDHPGAPVDAEVGAVLRRTIEALRAAGVTVEETALPGLDLPDLARLYQSLLFAVVIAGFPREVYDGLREMADSLPPEDESAMTRMARFGTARHRDWLAANEARQRQRAHMAGFFERFDVLLLPVTPVAAIPHDHSDPLALRTIEVNGAARSYLELFNWIALATMAYLPAAIAPAGRTAANLPVGVQIVAPYLEDRSAIDFARRLAEVGVRFEPPPGV